MKSLIFRTARRAPGGRVNDAFTRMRAAETRLLAETSPAARAATYTELGAIYQDLAGRRPADWLPPIEPGEGVSYEQSYHDMAVLAAVLAAAEPVAGEAGSSLPSAARTAPAAERDAWNTVFSTTDRALRAEVLGITLYELVSARVGTEAASVLSLAARSEKPATGGQ